MAMVRVILKQQIFTLSCIIMHPMEKADNYRDRHQQDISHIASPSPLSTFNNNYAYNIIAQPPTHPPSEKKIGLAEGTTRKQNIIESRCLPCLSNEHSFKLLCINFQHKYCTAHKRFFLLFLYRQDMTGNLYL